MGRLGSYVDPLDECMALVDDVADEAAADPLRYLRWMVPQLAFLALEGRAKAYRAGNQALGKSTVGLAEVLMHLRGSHPFRKVKRPPVNWVVCSLNQTQSLAIQGKFHALVGANELHKDCAWNPKTGYGANKPFTQFANGSTVRWVTDDQGPRAVAGSTLNGVLVDEPCSPEMLRELKKRLLRRAGTLLLTFTPINGPTEHIRDDIEAGRILEIHAPLTPENLKWADTGEIVTLEDGTPCDAKWIGEVWAQTSAMEADIVNNGGWERKIEGVYFHNFDAKRHSATAGLRRTMNGREGRLTWLLGLDYAAADREYGQCAVLVQVLEVRASVGPSQWWVNVVDESVATGTIDTGQFADMVLSMLTRAGLTWDRLDVIHGDNPVSSRWEERSNGIMLREIAGKLARPQKSMKKRIMNAKEGVRADRQLTEGCRMLYRLIGEGRVNIAPRCQHLIKGVQTWDLTSSHPYKDIIDALRYALKPVFFPHGVKAAATSQIRFAA